MSEGVTYSSACFNTLGSRVALCCSNPTEDELVAKDGRASAAGTSSGGFSIHQLPTPHFAPNASFASQASSAKSGTSSADGSTPSLLVQSVLPTENVLGGVKMVALLHTVPLVFVVPSSTDRVLQLFDLKTRNVLAEVQFDSTILNLLVNTRRLVVVAERTMHLFDWTAEGMPCITQNHPIQTFHPVNKLGLATLSEVHPETGSCYLAFPQSSATSSTASTAVSGSSKGEVFLVEAMNAHQLGSLHAHSGLVQALKFTPNGSMLATASDKGTIIRVFATPSKDLLYTFRRGMSQTTIYDLRFSLDMQLLAATASSGRVHIFRLGVSGGSFASRIAHGIGSLADVVSNATGSTGASHTAGTTDDGTLTAHTAEDDATISTSTERALVKLDLPAGTIHSQCIIDAGNTCITVMSLVSARKKKRGANATTEPSDGQAGDVVTPIASTYRLGRDLKADLVKQYPLAGKGEAIH